LLATDLTSSRKGLGVGVAAVAVALEDEVEDDDDDEDDVGERITLLQSPSRTNLGFFAAGITNIVVLGRT
jgi:hypothetical protein